MKRARFFLIIAIAGLLSVFLLQCSSNTTEPAGNNNITQPPPAEGLIGAWQSTDFTIVSQEDTSLTVDLSQFGVTLTMTINPDSTYSSATTFQGQDITETGTISVHGNQFTIQPDNGNPRTGTFTLSGDNLTITTEDEEYDFDQDGSTEPAMITVALQKLK